MQFKGTFSYRVLLRCVSPMGMIRKWQIKCASSNAVWQYNSYMWKTVIQVVLFIMEDWLVTETKDFIIILYSLPEQMYIYVWQLYNNLIVLQFIICKVNYYDKGIYDWIMLWIDAYSV